MVEGELRIASLGAFFEVPAYVFYQTTDKPRCYAATNNRCNNAFLSPGHEEDYKRAS
jgi:hypothetical protein